MNEDIHSEDEHFKKAYGRMEEDPSPEVWEKINARLDGQDAVYYRNRFVTWKRIACLLLLLLGTTVLYQVFTPKEQKATLVNTQPKTASDSDPSESAKEHSPGNDAAHQNAGKSIDTNNSLQDAQSNRMVRVQMHNSHYHQQPLSAHNNTENTNERSAAPFETSAHSPYKQPLLTDIYGNQIRPQEVPNQTSSDSSFQQEQQIIKPLTGNTGSYKEDQITRGANDESVFKRDSIRMNGASIDSVDSRKQPVAVAAKTTIRIHNPSTGSWTVTPFASADITSYALDDDDHGRGGGNQPEHHKQEIEGRETHQFSFSAGAFVKWQFLPRFSLKTGLVYSNISIGIQPQTLYASHDNNQSISYKFITSSGYAYVKPVFGSVPSTGDSITAEISHHHLQFLAVPLIAGYKFSANRRITITPGIGVNTNLLLSTRIKTEVNEDTDKEMIVINKLQGIRKTYFSFMADAEINYFLNKRFSLSLLPMFKYAINPITKDNVVNTFPYSLSVGAGLTYSF